MGRPRKKPWTQTVEEAGERVRLYERGGAIYREVRENGRKTRASLKHKNRELAAEQAKQLCKNLAHLRAAGLTDALTLTQAFHIFFELRGPQLSPEWLKAAETRRTLFLTAWGGEMDLRELGQSHVDAFCDARRSGRILPPVFTGEKKRRGYRAPRPVRDGTLHADFGWLSTVFNYLRKQRTGGRPMLAFNPLFGLTVPREKNPRRPVAGHDRFLATLTHADAADPTGRLRCMLTLARRTGHRVEAICRLRVSDLLLDPTQAGAVLASLGFDESSAKHWPNGAIHWRAENDKIDNSHVAPLHREARAALDTYLRASGRIGDAWLFPADAKDSEPISRERAGKLLRKAEKLAKLQKLNGSLWHAYRRLWATERKHLPDVDTAAAGGWKGIRALKSCYQGADPVTLARVVEL